jgi:hypothetical protein
MTTLTKSSQDSWSFISLGFTRVRSYRGCSKAERFSISIHFLVNEVSEETNYSYLIHKIVLSAEMRPQRS